MKLLLNDKKLIVEWEYYIRRKERVIDDKKYYHYSCSFPTELKEFWDDTDFVFFSENEEKENEYILSPVPVDDAKKIRISQSGRGAWSFSLPKKIIPHIDKKSFVKISFDGLKAKTILF